MQERLQEIINKFEHTRSLLREKLVAAAYECDFELMRDCQDAIRKLDEAIDESNRVMQMLQAR